MHYNFVRLHQTLEVTPAMAAGVTSKLWRMSGMVKVLEDWRRRVTLLEALASLLETLSRRSSMKALIALAIAALGIGLSPAAFAQTGIAPRTKTESALDCLVGLEPDGCETVFKSAKSARQSTTYCTEEFTHRALDNCYNGVLESVEYLGTDAAGADVYDLKYMNAEMTYVIFPPARHGKIPGFRIFDDSPNSVLGQANHSLVAVTSPAVHMQPLYSRPNQGN